MSASVLPMLSLIEPALTVRRAALLGAALALLPGTALAQSGDAVPVISQPVVQAVPGSTGMKLNDVLNRLARNPGDVATLIEAGKASMQLGDPAAAVGFYQRAARLAPGNPNVKAGLAGAYSLSDDPITAINLFNEAERAGAIDPALLSPRGLAYDLVGDSETAQRYYRQALTAGPDDETIRRLALSQAISGDRRGMEVTLTPLLQKQDKGAWRMRAFALAILGQGSEAESIVRSTMPAQLAEPMSAYLRYMPRLTAAQQAAAANLGQFPRAADIGREDPRFAALQRPRAVLAAATPPPAALSRASGRDAAKDRKRAKADELKPVKPAPAVRVVATASSAPVAPVATRETTSTPPVTTAVPVPVQPAPKPVVVAVATPPSVLASVSAAPPASPPAGSAAPGFASLGGGAAAVAPGFDLKQVTPQPASQPALQPAPAVAAAAPPPAPTPVAAPAPAPRPRNLADLFADLSPPSREAEPVAGAVDVRRLAAAAKLAEAKAAETKAADAKAKELAKEKATKASAAAKQPSRVWVQVATGRDKSALAYDWRRLTRENTDVLGKRQAYVSAWGQTNRLLTGPFDSTKAANTFLGQLKKAGVSGGFIWTSPAGQVVDGLASGK